MWAFQLTIKTKKKKKQKEKKKILILKWHKSSNDTKTSSLILGENEVTLTNE